MKSSKIISYAFFAILVLSSISCKKTEPGTNESNGNIPPTDDFGYAIIYTSDYVYTDPLKGSVTNDNIEVSVDNSSKGKISYVAGSKIIYGTKNTVSVKLPVGKITVKGTTTSGATRTTNATITKNDTMRIKLDFSYNDPNSNSYYIEYYDNGIKNKFVSNLHKWIFYFGNHEPMYGGLPWCQSSFGYYNFDGPSYNSPLLGNNSGPSLRILRSSWKLKPGIGSYSFNSKDLDPLCGGATVYCSKADSYASLKITEVKVIEDMGLEKRGYYSGTFDAILYYSPNFFSDPQKHVITNGKFLSGLGGIQFQ